VRTLSVSLVASAGFLCTSACAAQGAAKLDRKTALALAEKSEMRSLFSPQRILLEHTALAVASRGGHRCSRGEREQG
jgi:hypothetical protein